MIDTRLFMVPHLVVNYTEVDVGKEFSSYICNLFVLLVILYSLCIVFRILLPQFHVINANAVVGKSFSVNVTYRSTNLKEPLVLLNSIFVLSQIVIQNTSGVVSSSLISRFTGSFASERQHFVVLQTFLGRNPIVSIRVTHTKSTVISEHFICQRFRPTNILIRLLTTYLSVNLCFEMMSSLLLGVLK